jgi:hypothetical protein
VLVTAHTEHAPRRHAVDLGDPGPLAGGIVLLGEAGGDPRDQHLERLVPAVLARVELAVALDHPSQVAGSQPAHHDRARAGRVAEQAGDRRRGRDQAPLAAVVELREERGAGRRRRPRPPGSSCARPTPSPRL